MCRSRASLQIRCMETAFAVICSFLRRAFSTVPISLALFHRIGRLIPPFTTGWLLPSSPTTALSVTYSLWSPSSGPLPTVLYLLFLLGVYVFHFGWHRPLSIRHTSKHFNAVPHSSVTFLCYFKVPLPSFLYRHPTHRQVCHLDAVCRAIKLHSRLTQKLKKYLKGIRNPLFIGKVKKAVRTVSIRSWNTWHFY